MTDAEKQLTALMDAYGGMLMGLCSVTLGDRCLAEDALQEVFLRAYRALARGETLRSERAWLIRVAVNVCRDWTRTAWFRHVDRRVPLDALPEQTASPDFHDSGVLEAVRRLPVTERQIVLMYFWQDMRAEEISRALGVNRATVFRRLNRARKQLRDMVERWDSDD